ncbi:hypothetical protein CEG14_24745 [Bordetella genomosp. 1]|nr:ABC-type transport auxiliary lipoprotein family protein [Bordetella genomosp. 1]OZI28292.1 hypothetical protein CEG14_24745 [Bordetella genomosp. 1]
MTPRTLTRCAPLVLAAILLAGCSVGRVGTPPGLFDLGPSADTAAVSPLPPRVPIQLAYTASPVLYESGVIWRVGESASPKSYATYRWTQPPATLVRERLIDRLSLEGAVMVESAVPAAVQLQVSLVRFEQVFAADGQRSEGRIVLQAVAIQDRKVLGQTRVARAVPAPTQDAPGGVQALRQATDAAADELAGWLARTLPPPAPPRGG